MGFKILLNNHKLFKSLKITNKRYRSRIPLLYLYHCLWFILKKHIYSLDNFRECPFWLNTYSDIHYCRCINLIWMCRCHHGYNILSVVFCCVHWFLISVHYSLSSVLLFFFCFFNQIIQFSDLQTRITTQHFFIIIVLHIHWRYGLKLFFFLN